MASLPDPVKMVLLALSPWTAMRRVLADWL